MVDKVKKEVIDLYFNKMYSYSRLQEHFKDKYSYAELKGVISKYLKEKQK
jgi:hypothetical protein